MLSDTLAQAGFEVAIATSGEGALQQLEHIQVSLILLDVMMPGMDGFETCQHIKANAKTRNGLIYLYQQEYSTPSAIIQDEIEAIDLDYIREDLPKLVASMREGVKRIRNISTSLRTFSSC